MSKNKNKTETFFRNQITSILLMSVTKETEPISNEMLEQGKVYWFRVELNGIIILCILRKKHFLFLNFITTN